MNKTSHFTRKDFFPGQILYIKRSQSSSVFKAKVEKVGLDSLEASVGRSVYTFRFGSNIPSSEDLLLPGFVFFDLDEYHSCEWELYLKKILSYWINQNPCNWIGTLSSDQVLEIVDALRIDRQSLDDFKTSCWLQLEYQSTAKEDQQP